MQYSKYVNILSSQGFYWVNTLIYQVNLWILLSKYINVLSKLSKYVNILILFLDSIE